MPSKWSSPEKTRNHTDARCVIQIASSEDNHHKQKKKSARTQKKKKKATGQCVIALEQSLALTLAHFKLGVW